MDFLNDFNFFNASVYNGEWFDYYNGGRAVPQVWICRILVKTGPQAWNSNIKQRAKRSLTNWNDLNWFVLTWIAEINSRSEAILIISLYFKSKIIISFRSQILFLSEINMFCLGQAGVASVAWILVHWAGWPAEAGPHVCLPTGKKLLMQLLGSTLSKDWNSKAQDPL